MKSFHFLKVSITGLLLMLKVSSYGQSFKTNPHKFNAASWSFTERCNPCHIYNSETGTSTNFSLSFETDSLSSQDSLYVSGISKLCYTCHDGTVAVFNHSSDFLSLNSGDDTIDSSHPVSVKYQFSETGKLKLYNPDSTLSGLGGTIAEDMLKNGRVECTSCHDAHFSMEMTACSSCPPTKPNKHDTNDNPSLWKTTKKSILCLTCHKL